VCQQALLKGDAVAITQGCERALDVDTTLVLPILAWAMRELDRGNVKVAVTWARHLLRANDQLADAYLIVGVAEQAASHASAARTAYRRYLELAPKGRYARDVRMSLAAL
jgi:Tfp pilus assembly protein PilF